MTLTFRLLLIWILASAVAFALQLNWMSATYTPDGFVPVGNDAFYHARRIIDSASDLTAFYEFDSKIHAPDGSLLTWPWGYDFVMALLLRGGELAGYADDPMKFLAYVPPFAVVITIALVLGIARALELSLVASVMLVLCVALSPLTQGMHSIGSIDHHYAEYMVVLAVMASSVWWLRSPESLLAAVSTGCVLGLGPAVHNGLFVLQALLLTCMTVLWLRGERLPPKAVAIFGLTLVATTLLILWPSLPFRLGLFSFYLLSWFHLYVACCTAVIALTFTLISRSTRAVLGLGVLGAALVAPIFGDVTMAGSFVGKEPDALKGIAETRSLWALYGEWGFYGTSRLYSGLIFLAPAVWVACAYALFKVVDRRMVLVCTHALLTLPLMLAQFRFQYFGSLALYLPLLAFVDRMSAITFRRQWLIASAALLGLAYYPALRDGLAGGIQLGNDPYYRMTRLAMPALADACEQDEGIVLARANDGHYIRYHTNCSVIANNFLLTEQHFEAVRRVNRMFDMTPEQLIFSGELVKYIFVRARGVLLVREDGSLGLLPQVDAASVSDRLSNALLWGDPADMPGEFELVHEVGVPGGEYQYARIWKIKGRREASGERVVPPSGNNRLVTVGRDAE